MAETRPLSTEDLVDICARAFPDRAGQTIVEVLPIKSRQHQMTSFELWWLNDAGVLKHEDLIVRRYVSTLSWWRPDDRGKAQREATVCRWLIAQDFPVPKVYVREFGPQGDVVLFSRLPHDGPALTGRTLKQAVEPHITQFARLLAQLHSLTPPDPVRQVVPKVTLPGAAANLVSLAFQIGLPELHTSVQQVMQHAFQVQELSPVLLHGDYHFLNALLHDNKISGIIDWEYSAIGDPRWDVANAYMQLVDFGAAEAADKFLATYLHYSGLEFEGPPLYNVITPLQQWAISEWLVQVEAKGELPGFALAQDLVASRDIHRNRAMKAMQWLDQ